MFIVYGQAVEHPAMIFRPAQFLISFEFARKILSAKRAVSLLYAVMVTFSLPAQWWWSVNSIAEILATAGFLWCAGIYILSIYPAWQVPFGWTFLLCMVAATVAADGVSKILWRDKIFRLGGVIVTLALRSRRRRSSARHRRA